MSRTTDPEYKRNRDRLKRQGDLVCALCGQPIDLDLPQYDPMAFWADHPDPVARGGDNGQALVAMHGRCNRVKGTKSLDAVRVTVNSRRWY